MDKLNVGKLSSVLLSVLFVVLLSAIIFIVLLVPYALRLAPTLLKQLSYLSSLETLWDMLKPFMPILILLQTTAQTIAYVLVVYRWFLKTKLITLKQMGVYKQDIFKQLMQGIVFALVIALSALVYDFFLVKAGLSGQGPGGRSFLYGVNIRQAILVFISQGVLGPLGEEFFFRGYIFSALLVRYRLIASLIYSSLIFTLLHGLSQNSPIIFIHGIMYGYFLYRSKSLVSVAAAHSINNCLTLNFMIQGINWY